MTDSAAALRVAKQVSDDLALVEEDLERLLDSNRNMARSLADLDAKVSGLAIELRSASRSIADTLTLHGRLLEDALAKLRTPK